MRQGERRREREGQIGGERKRGREIFDPGQRKKSRERRERGGGVERETYLTGDKERKGEREGERERERERGGLGEIAKVIDKYS